MEIRTYGFEKLQVWQEARGLTKSVYQITQLFPESEKFGLTNQMRRATISVASNIAEGAGRSSEKERQHFYRMAYSSLMELLNQLIISADLEYLPHDEFEKLLRPKIESISSKLFSLKGKQ